MRLNEIKAVTEGIAIGNSYTIMSFNAMNNTRRPTEVKVVDYIKAPGERDMVVYKGKDGKTKKLAVNTFKARLADITEDDGMGSTVYKVFVNTAGDPEDSWATNGIDHPTVEAAEEAAKDLFMRWTAVNKWRVMDPDQENVYAEGP